MSLDKSIPDLSDSLDRLTVTALRVKAERDEFLRVLDLTYPILAQLAIGGGVEIEYAEKVFAQVGSALAKVGVR
jgi:hypothetical protein